jgi:type IV pilus assembly protein PilZ
MMSQENGERQEAEQRTSDRAPIELKVEYQRMNSFFSDYTRNISRGGTFVGTDNPLDIGTRFAFKLQIPALTEPLALTGEVRWVRQVGESGDPGMGIPFIFANDSERAVIDQVVERLMVDSLGRLIYSRLRDLEDGRQRSG